MAIADYSTIKWAELTLPTMISLIRGPLQGFESLHQAGYMHRDVQLRNILAIDLDPPHGVLCDFGKAIHSKTGKDSAIDQ